MKESKIFAEYRAHMGDDLMVANAARTSFGKESVLERVCWNCGHAASISIWSDDECPNCHKSDENPILGDGLRLKKADASLIQFLASGYRAKEWEELLDQVTQAAHARDMTGDDVGLINVLRAYKNKAQHWAPFAHPHIQIRMQLPIFLARQFVKHQVGGVWSEESRRYISEEPEVYIPRDWHTRPDDIKQGSGIPVDRPGSVEILVRDSTQTAVDTYMALVDPDDFAVAPEEARMILPLNMMTTVTWTGSLLFWSRVCNQRVDSHAQRAAQDLGKQISAITQPLFPVSWAALVGDK